MKRVLTALVLIPLVLLAVFRSPDWLFTLLVGVVAVLATIEYLQIAAKYGYKLYPVVTIATEVLIFAAVVKQLLNGFGGALAFVAVASAVFMPSVLLASGMRNENLRDVLPGAGLSLFAVPYIGLAMLCLALLRAMPGGWFYVLFTFFAVWVGDTAAYYVGRSIGKRKFAARISPKKTWEGAIASVIGAMVIAVLWTGIAPALSLWLAQHRVMSYFQLWSPPSLLGAAFIACLINVAAQMGDLFESLIKRGADVKDSGTMLPGHGGILDRIDALLFAAPVALVIFLIWGGRFFKTVTM